MVIRLRYKIGFAASQIGMIFRISMAYFQQRPPFRSFPVALIMAAWILHAPARAYVFLDTSANAAPAAGADSARPAPGPRSPTAPLPPAPAAPRLPAASSPPPAKPHFRTVLFLSA